MRKKGVSLLILIITVIVLSILVTASITGINGAINSAKKVTFTKELLEIKENVVARIVNKDFSWKVGNSIDVNAMADGLTSTKKNEFINKVNSLGASKMYKIDIKKLGVTSTKKGLGETNSDCYYVQMNTEETVVKNIIYPEGIKVGKKYYFYLTEDLLQDAEIEEQVGESNTSLNTELKSKLYLEKIDKEYTNEIKFKVNEQAGTLMIGDANVNSLNCRAEINNGVTVWNKDTFTSLDISNINTVKVELDGKYTIADISNLDVEEPVISNVEATKNATNYEVKITATDDKSGIENYIIIPTLKTGNEEYYPLDKKIYTNGAVSEPNYSRYVKTFGKKSKSSILHLPSDTVRFAVGVEDRAGNIVIKDYKI